MEGPSNRRKTVVKGSARSHLISPVYADLVYVQIGVYMVNHSLSDFLNYRHRRSV